MGKWGPPSGLVEGSPGLFYSVGGVANQVAFSITSPGSENISGELPHEHLRRGIFDQRI
jgi:hypothetical protein